MNNDDIASTFCGTMPWTAPEIFNGSGYTTKADVFSFGTSILVNNYINSSFNIDFRI